MNLNNPTLTISAKQLDPTVKYINPTKTLNEVKNKTVFTMESLEEEVKQLNKKQKKKLAKICKITLATMIPLLTMGDFVSASTEMTSLVASTQPTPIEEMSLKDMIQKEDIMKWGIWIVGIFTGISSVFTIVLLQLAGSQRQLRKRSEATDWTTDILKGYAQILLAPIIVLTIAFLGYLLFGTSSWYVNPF